MVETFPSLLKYIGSVPISIIFCPREHAYVSARATIEIAIENLPNRASIARQPEDIKNSINRDDSSSLVFIISLLVKIGPKNPNIGKNAPVRIEIT